MDDREVFFQVVQANGFAAAAQRLDTTPASVSRRIKALETRLGVRLLQRTTRKISLTEAGERYYQEARTLTTQLTELEQALVSSSQELAGELRLVAPMSFGQRIVAPLITRFAKQHPKLRITLLLEDRDTDLFDASADLAIRIGWPSDSSLIAREIGEVPRYVCASPRYLKTHGAPSKPQDLLAHTCLHYNLISEREEWSFRARGGTQTLSITGSFCSNNGDVLLQAALDGLGISLLPSFIVDDSLRRGKLVRVLEKFEREPMKLFAVYPSRHHVPAKTRELLRFLQEKLSA